jgi:hypothetical protein
MNQMSQMNQNQTLLNRKKLIEVTVAKIMENIKIELELDQLQEIAISNVVAESIREQGILLKAETNQEQKQKKCKHFLKLQIGK